MLANTGIGDTFKTAISFVIVGAIWGCTNPFLKEGTEEQSVLKKDSRIAQFFYELYLTFTNWKVFSYGVVIKLYFHFENLVHTSFRCQSKWLGDLLLLAGDI